MMRPMTFCQFALSLRVSRMLSGYSGECRTVGVTIESAAGVCRTGLFQIACYLSSVTTAVSDAVLLPEERHN